MRRRATLVAAAVLAVSVAVGGLSAGTAGATSGPGNGWTSTPVAPVLTIPMADVGVAVTAPTWAFDRAGSEPSIPVSWRPTIPLPSEMTILYDVEWRSGAAIDQLAWERDWTSFLTGTSATSATFNSTTNGGYVMENADAVEWRVRAVDPVSAEAGPWSAPVVSNIPMDDNSNNQTWEVGTGYHDLTFGHSWTSYAYAGDFYGAEHTTTTKTIVGGGFLPFHGPRLVIIGMKCAHCGKFTIDMQGGRGGHTFTKPVTVDTYSKTTQHRVVLCQIPLPNDEMWLFQIDTLATSGRPRVSVDAWGVTHLA